MVVEKLASSLYFIQKHWGTNSNLGHQLLQAYELFQLETGLGGNILDKDFRHPILGLKSFGAI
jgi:hypothetical protein